MKNKVIKMFLVLMAFLLVFTPLSSVMASSHSSNSLFDFYSNRDIADERYNNFTEEEQSNVPISNVIEDKDMKTTRMIVLTSKSMTPKEQKELLGKYGTYNRDLPSVVGFSAYIPEKNVDVLLRENNEIVDIYVDSVVRTLGFNEPIPSEVVSAPTVWNFKQNKGSGVGVAVLDTGVYPHKDLNVVGFKDFINNRNTPYDDNGHGTHVAGLIAGDGTMSKGKIKGVAPEVDIVGVKVLDSREKGYISNVISGIEWVIANKDKYNIKVMNLSLGTQYSGTQDPMMKAVERAVSEGITVVVAGGNSGYNGKVTSPAASENAIAVGSTDHLYTLSPLDDKPSTFSVLPQSVNGVIKPEIYAPGTNAISTLSLEGNRTFSDRGNIVDAYYYRSSGTSMSAPLVSGVAAMLYSQNPNITPNAVKNKIISNSIKKDNINILNAAKVFDLEPTWEEVEKEAPKEIPNLPDTLPVNENEQVDNSNDNEDFNETKNNNKEAENGDDKGYEVIHKRNEDNKKESEDDWTFPSYDEVDEQTPPETIFTTKTKEDKVEADIPVVNPYQINNGYPFVEEVYEKRNVLEDLVENSSKYSNEEEIIYEYESVKDIIMLFNLINRSFTRQDFLYFEQRLNN